MILKENTLVVSKDLDFTFEEMISLEIALINKGKLLPTQKLDYDKEGNIIVWYGQTTDCMIGKDNIFTQDEEDIINTFLESDFNETENLDNSDTQSIQSIPQNLMDTIMTGQEQASNATPVYNNPGQAVASTSTAQPSTSHIRSYPIGQPPRESYSTYTQYNEEREDRWSRGKRQPLETLLLRQLNINAIFQKKMAGLTTSYILRMLS